MRLSRQFQFFKERKTSDSSPLRSFCARKTVAFAIFCSLVFVLLVGFCLICVFVRLTFFRRKKKKQTWNCLDKLIYYTTDKYSPQPPYREFICTYLYLQSSVRISYFYENLFESFFICENLFFLWESSWIPTICVNVCLYENK